MDTRLKKFLFVLTLVAGCFLLVTYSLALTPEELRKSIDDRIKELEEINTQIQEAQKNINLTEQKGKTLNQEIKRYDYQINQLNLGIKSSQIKVEKLGLEIDSLAYDIGNKEEEIDFKKNAIVGFLRELQEKTRESTLMIFLKNKSLAESLFETQSIDNLNQSLALEIGKLQIIKTDLSDKLDATAKRKNQIEIENRNLKNKKSITEDQKNERWELLTTTKSQERLYQQQLKELEKKQAEIGEAIEEIESQLRASFDPNLLPIKRPGVLANPLNGVGVITQEYGATTFARRAYSTKFHNGVDFGAPFGTPVLASRAGKVTAVGDNGRYQYGRYVLIEHENGLTTLYAHLARFIVAKGIQVAEGQTIGYIGNTGYSYGNHLHLTVYWSTSVILKAFPNCNCGLVPVGVTINPIDYLAKI